MKKWLLYDYLGFFNPNKYNPKTSVVDTDVINPEKKMLIFMNNADAVDVLYKTVINYLKSSTNKSVSDLSRSVYRLSGSLSKEVTVLSLSISLYISPCLFYLPTHVLLSKLFVKVYFLSFMSILNFIKICTAHIVFKFVL